MFSSTTSAIQKADAQSTHVREPPNLTYLRKSNKLNYEPETGTVNTVLPRADRRTETAGTVLQEPLGLLLNINRNTQEIFCSRIAVGQNGNHSNRFMHEA